MCSQLQSVSSGKRKLEVDVQQLTQEHEELHTELRAANDKAKKSACEVQSDTDTHTHTALRDGAECDAVLPSAGGACAGGAACGAGAHHASGARQEEPGAPDEGHERQTGGS